VRRRPTSGHFGSSRRAGVLLHPTSLPGPWGIGDLGDEAIAFLDWAVAAGLTVWQVLPLGPTGAGNSPYGSLSAFAGNPTLISPERLVAERFVERDEIAPPSGSDPDRVDFGEVIPWKIDLLRKAWDRFTHSAEAWQREAFDEFCDDERTAAWLDDWAIFMAIKVRSGGVAWTEWQKPLRDREPGALEEARVELADEIAFQRFAQFIFFRQWERVRAEAHARGILIVGDVPIYVALDSADVWAHPELFLLDAENRPAAVAGVPPDYFSPTGQRWGNPLYRWDRMRENGYAWWAARFGANFRMCDIVRLDHFRGFAAYWEIPAEEPTAQNGRWMPGPGIDFFRAMKKRLPSLQFIAEDLGEITDDVEDLRDEAGLPGMKVLQFGFGEDDAPHQPHRFVDAMIVYTGTHDNDTTRGWYESADAATRERIDEYLGPHEEPVERRMVRAAYTSVAELVIVPIQDIAGLGSEARMNVPGDASDNWAWRARRGHFRRDDARRLRRLAELTGRLPRGR
jgi:4-alpha-glucanotransferase